MKVELFRERVTFVFFNCIKSSTIRVEIINLEDIRISWKNFEEQIPFK